MTIYRLRDIERQDALRKALPHFEEMFLRDCYMQMKNDKNYVRVSLPVSEKDSNYCSYLWTIRLRKSDIEILYDPNSWNNYPDVTPPEGVRMRVEKKGNNGRTIRDCAVYKNGHWIYDSAYPEKVVNPCWWMGDVDRFRPWN